MKYQDAKLDDLLGTLIDYRGKTPLKAGAGIPLITAKVIKGGRILDGNHEYIAEDYYDEWMRRGLPHQWDVLITTEAPLGEVAILKSSAKVALAQRVILLRGDKEKINQRYLCFALQSPLVQARLNARATGATVAGIKQSELREVLLPVYQLPTQRRIASILSAYDDLIENNTRRISILEEMARRIYEEWFVRFRFPGHEEVKMVESELGLIPEGWEITNLDSVAEYINRGLTPKYDDMAEGLVINQKCIRGQKLSYELARKQSKPIPIEKRIRYGDVVINSTGVGTLGRVAQVLDERENCTADTHVTIVRPGSRVKVHFFGMALLAMEQYFEQQGVGATGQTELGRSRVAETVFVLPPYALQEKFDALVAPMRGLVVKLATKNANLRATRDLLLPKLISGELDVSSLPEPEEGITA